MRNVTSLEEKLVSICYEEHAVNRIHHNLSMFHIKALWWRIGKANICLGDIVACRLMSLGVLEIEEIVVGEG